MFLTGNSALQIKEMFEFGDKVYNCLRNNQVFNRKISLKYYFQELDICLQFSYIHRVIMYQLVVLEVFNQCVFAEICFSVFLIFHHKWSDYFSYWK